VGFFKQQPRRPSSEELVELWSIRDTPNLNVVGESHYARQIRGLLPQRISEAGAEVRETVTLRHDAGNRHDANAVEIRARTGTVGFLAREDARRYAPHLAASQRNGRVISTSARIWGAERGGFIGSVRLVLPSPHLMRPVNEPPEVHRLLPAGKAIQVADEELHREALLPFLRSEGECWVHATLHAAGSNGKRHAEVRVDGLIVGRLTPKMSADLLPVVDFLAEQGEACVARAVVMGNHLKTEVTLYVQRAHELDQTWLTSKTAVPVADWYPDPHGSARLRYWDGSQWTSHTAQ
jgi:uncharacterized protein DUF2510